MAMNHYDMEANSRIENLVAFKKAYGGSLLAVTHCLEKFFPRMTDEDVQGFLYAFFPFMFGIYPYTAVTGAAAYGYGAGGRRLCPAFCPGADAVVYRQAAAGISNVREEVRRTRRSVSCLNDSPAPDPARGCFSWVEAAEDCGDAAFPTGAAGKGAEILEGPVGSTRTLRPAGPCARLQSSIEGRPCRCPGPFLKPEGCHDPPRYVTEKDCGSAFWGFHFGKIGL